MRRVLKLILCCGLGLLTACGSNTNKQIVDAREHFDQQNYASAYDKLLRLAKRGDPEAQYAIGYMSYYGMGAPKDENLARIWIRRSAESGYPEAVQAYKLIAHDKLPTQPELVATTSPRDVKHRPRAPNPMMKWIKDTLKKKELV